jgi:prepilin-type N-terminal cleavage/methylation domain-containing protein
LYFRVIHYNLIYNFCKILKNAPPFRLSPSGSLHFLTFDAHRSFKPLKANICGVTFLKSSQNWARQSFTLVELLVVIAILSILMMLIQPALRSALQKTTGLSCLNNLNKIGSATLTYAGDHNNFIPGRDYNGFAQWQSYTSTAWTPSQVGYPPRAPQSAGLLHNGNYLRGPEVFFCPGRKAPDFFSSEQQSCSHNTCDNRWHGMGPGFAAYFGYMLAHGNYNVQDNNNLAFSSWTQLGRVNPGYILGMDVTGRHIDELRGASKCNHGMGVNVVLFDGSAGFREDPTSHLELVFQHGLFPNVYDGRPGFRNNPSHSPTAWLYINSYGRSQKWVDSLYE